MSHCVYCGADTALYVNEVPVCLGCVDELEAAKTGAAASHRCTTPYPTRFSRRVIGRDQ
jgi:hypothetical protein